MLSDYIPVYFPESNEYSIPAWEITEYKDYIPEPQIMTLHNGVKIRGIPLVHFGTWGLVGLSWAGLGELLRKLAKYPKRTCKGCYRSRKTQDRVAQFFTELKKKYPGIRDMTRFEPAAGDDLHVPKACIVR